MSGSLTNALELSPYEEVATKVESSHGSGLSLAVWTALRTGMIMPGMLIVRTPVKQAALGSLISSCMFTAYRIALPHFLKAINKMPEEGAPILPTYKTIADVIEHKDGSIGRLIGWTAARTALIIPAMLLVKVPPKKAIIGSVLSSCMMSTLTLIRIYLAGDDGATDAGSLPAAPQ